MGELYIISRFSWQLSFISLLGLVGFFLFITFCLRIHLCRIIVVFVYFICIWKLNRAPYKLTVRYVSAMATKETRYYLVSSPKNSFFLDLNFPYTAWLISVVVHLNYYFTRQIKMTILLKKVKRFLIGLRSGWLLLGFCSQDLPSPSSQLKHVCNSLKPCFNI